MRLAISHDVFVIFYVSAVILCRRWELVRGAAYYQKFQNGSVSFEYRMAPLAKKTLFLWNSNWPTSQHAKEIPGHASIPKKSSSTFPSRIKKCISWSSLFSSRSLRMVSPRTATLSVTHPRFPFYQIQLGHKIGRYRGDRLLWIFRMGRRAAVHLPKLEQELMR